MALHWRATLEVLDRACQLCASFCPVERRLGADILGQLGCPDRFSPKKCTKTLLGMLEREKDNTVLASILVALSHHRASEAIGLVSRSRRNADPEVRFGVVLALMGYEDKEGHGVLIELTRDAEAHVRNWATFALGTQCETDTPVIRDALMERLAETDDDTRCEAPAGLARRGDRRVLPALHKELACKPVGPLAIEAANLIGDPQCTTELIALKGCWDGDKSLLEPALWECSPDLRLASSNSCDEAE